ncbi:MAG TPA: glycosyltransferase family A protein [Caldimonas sp.]|nr:glycosyltransferase family A protein [Caldimonas sp.]
MAGDPDRLATRVGFVVIGRNEAARLPDCLRAVPLSEAALVYVDSGSRDASVAIARAHGAEVIDLDPARPFTAARARNEGFQQLLARSPAVEYVQFVDGDCALLPGWIQAAVAAMDSDARRAIVIGHLREREAGRGVYKRLCALEWQSAAGDIRNFGSLGGIMLVRVAPFRAVGGFNPVMIAGEDSELGVRLAAAGHVVTKIDVPMATHEADIRRFAQWWRRSVRSGHAIGQRSFMNGRGPARDCVRERRSTLFWGMFLPAAALLAAVPTRGVSLLLLLGYGVLAWRVFRHRRSRGDTPSDARLYAAFNVLGKFAEAVGLLTFFWNRATGSFRIIEYK